MNTSRANDGRIIIKGGAGGAPTVHVDGNDTGKEPLDWVLERCEEMGDRVNSDITELKEQSLVWTKEREEHARQLQAQKEEIELLTAWARQQDAVKEPGRRIYTPGDLAKEGKRVRHDFAMFCLDVMSFRINGMPKFNSPHFARAQTEGSTTGGGFLVAEEQLTEIVQIIENYGTVRRLFRVIPMNKLKMRVPTLTNRPSVYWPNEATLPAAESDAAFARPELEAKRAVAIDSISLEVEEDSAPMISDFLVDVFSLAFAKEEDTQGLAGTGSPFTGLLTVSGVQELVLSAGKVDFTDMTYSDLLDLVDTCDEFAAESNGRFVFSSSILLMLRKLVDSVAGRPLWQEMAAGPPNTIFGFPYTRSAVMPKQSDTAVSTEFILFGDFRNVAMGTRNDLAVDFSRDVSFKTAEVVMRVMERVGFVLLLGAGIARLKTAAV